MLIHPLPLSGAAVVDTTPYRDNRGSFARFFCANELAELVGERRIININHSRTAKPGAVRGMHFQRPPKAEMKLIRCLKGKVWDVAVDLRKGSSTFLKWHAETLTPENARMIIIPEGFAHGFQALEADSELLYLHTAPYAPECEGGLRFDDPALGITWPLGVTELSERDGKYPLLDGGFEGISL